MSRDWKYIAFLVFAAVLFLLVRILSPREYDWTITFHSEDKNPYGAYAFSRLLPTALKSVSIHQSYNTFYELLDTLSAPATALSISLSFSPDPADAETLLRNVAAGGTAFISARSFGKTFSDTLGIELSDVYTLMPIWNADKNDSSILTSVVGANANKSYVYPRRNIPNYFSRFDSTKTAVVARNDFEKPVTLVRKYGKGLLILNSTPLIFTNIHLLHRDNYLFAESQLATLPIPNGLYWTEYYQLGRMEPTTPLRVILTHESLRWAYYITVFTLLVFVFFEMKRKQRIIPVINPLANTTLEFVRTIGNMHFEQADHAGIASKRVTFLLEHIRERFRLNTGELNDLFEHELAQKSGVEASVVSELTALMKQVLQTVDMQEKDLVVLNEKIENFTKLAFSKKN
jgi:Domain of unknown function (DUF4350)